MTIKYSFFRNGLHVYICKLSSKDTYRILRVFYFVTRKHEKNYMHTANFIVYCAVQCCRIFNCLLSLSCHGGRVSSAGIVRCRILLFAVQAGPFATIDFVKPGLHLGALGCVVHDAEKSTSS